MMPFSVFGGTCHFQHPPLLLPSLDGVQAALVQLLESQYRQQLLVGYPNLWSYGECISISPKTGQQDRILPEGKMQVLLESKVGTLENILPNSPSAIRCQITFCKQARGFRSLTGRAQVETSHNDSQSCKRCLTSVTEAACVLTRILPKARTKAAAPR